MEFLLDYSQFHVSNALFKKQMLLSVTILKAVVSFAPLKCRTGKRSLAVSMHA